MSTPKPARRAMATTWMMALVEPPIAMCTRMALSKAAGVRSFCGVRSSHTMSTMRRPACPHMRGWPESAAGIDDAPGSVSPSASAIAIMVAAVPITMQVPKERAMPPSSSAQSASLMRPARFSSQYFQASEPEPSTCPRQFPLSCGPAGTKIAGTPMLMAPMIRPGVVLSQPPISTAPSIGWLRNSSSVSIASRLR